jgi:hypothetical protein
MRLPHTRCRVRLATVAVTLAVLLLAVVRYLPVQRWADRSRIATRPARQEARVGSEQQPDGATVAAAGSDALGERLPVEVEGKPLILDEYAAFPALGDLDGDGRPDLLLGGPYGFLKVFRNLGSPGHPRLAAPVSFGNFCDDERIPTG